MMEFVLASSAFIISLRAYLVSFFDSSRAYLVLFSYSFRASLVSSLCLFTNCSNYFAYFLLAWID